MLQENRTKADLTEALKVLMRKKSLDQIRIRELTDLCGLRRQSFYYHFTDVYDLFAWSVRQERELLLRRQAECLTWQQALRDLLRYTEEDRTYYQALWESQGRQGLRQVLGGVLEALSKQVEDYYQRRCGVARSPEEAALGRQCGTAVLLALLEAWICGDLPWSADAVAALLEKRVRQTAAGAMWQNLPQWDRE